MAASEKVFSVDPEAVKDNNVIANIQSRADRSYIILCNGYPYHATIDETPDVYRRVVEEIKLGASVTEYMEPEAIAPDPLAQAVREIARLRAAADYAIAPLQDAVDVDEATEVEVAALKAWKKYRIALSRVPERAGYPKGIEWPVVPA